MTDFGTIRNTNRILDDEASFGLLDRSVSGTLSVNGPDGYPYSVPMHFVRDGSRLLFHTSSAEGLLLKSVRSDGKASFTVHETDPMLNSNSVILFGEVHEEPDQWDLVIERYIDKYVPERFRDNAMMGIQRGKDKTTCLIMDITHISGKKVTKP